MNPLERLVAPDPRLDTYSETWNFISEWAEAGLKDLHEAIESPKKTEAQTMVLRGEIKRLRALLALAVPPKERKRPPPDDF